MSLAWTQCYVILSKEASRWMDDGFPSMVTPVCSHSLTKHKPQSLPKTLSDLTSTLSVSFSPFLCHMRIVLWILFCFFDIISMAAIIPCHYCASLSPRWFNSNNTHSRRLSYPLRGLRGLNARCSYQPPHHSESQNNHVSLLKIWFFFFFLTLDAPCFTWMMIMLIWGLEMWCPISIFIFFCLTFFRMNSFGRWTGL